MDAPAPPSEPSRSRLAHPELEALRAADRARDEALVTFNDAARARWKRQALLGMVAFPLATLLLSRGGLHALYLQWPLALLWATYVTFARPTGLGAVVVTVVTGLGCQLAACFVAGRPFWFEAIVGLLAYAAAGCLVATGERARVLDGR